MDSSKRKTASAACPAGATLVGGGHKIRRGFAPVSLLDSRERPEGAWKVIALEITPFSGDWWLRAFAHCVEGES